MDKEPGSHTLDDKRLDVLMPQLEQGVESMVMCDRPGSPVAAREHNATLPIHSLPDEIFLECLFLSIDFITLNKPVVPQLHALAQVCAYWMYSIRSHARFWHLINVKEPDWIDTTLKKNPNGPLLVRCLDWEPGESLDFLRIARKLAPRLEGIAIRSGDELGSGGVELVEAFLPLLISLEIENYYQCDITHTILLSAPALEHLDISHVYLHWNSPSLVGFKYLRIADLDEGIPSLVQFLSILQASPQLAWLGLQHISSKSSTTNAQEAALIEPSGVVTLLALRGLDLGITSDPLTKFLIASVDVPNCNLISLYLPFDEIFRPGSTCRNLISIPMQADDTKITVVHSNSTTSIEITSELENQSLAIWAFEVNHLGSSVRIDDVPYGVEPWTRVMDVIRLPSNGSTYELSLFVGYGPPVFSENDLSFWASASFIGFTPKAYPHTLSALRYLSQPFTNHGGEVQWPCPQLNSVSIFSEGVVERWSTEARLELVSVILELLENRRVFLQGDSTCGGALTTTIKTVMGPTLLIEMLRGKVPEGVWLYTLSP